MPPRSDHFMMLALADQVMDFKTWLEQATDAVEGLNLESLGLARTFTRKPLGSDCFTTGFEPWSTSICPSFDKDCIRWINATALDTVEHLPIGNLMGEVYEDEGVFVRLNKVLIGAAGTTAQVFAGDIVRIVARESSRHSEYLRRFVARELRFQSYADFDEALRAN